MRNKYTATWFGNSKPGVREIQVVSSLPAEENEHPENDVIQNNPSSSQLAMPLTLQTLKIAAVPLLASFSSLSLPILIILAEKELGTHEHQSLEQKILEPLLPYLVLVALRTWIVWNNIGHRMNGQADADMVVFNETYEEDPVHVTIALLANTANFADAFLVGRVALSDAPPAAMWSGAIILGSLNYIMNLFTENVDAFRKHVESRQKQGRQIAPFLKQKYIAKLICNHPEYFGIVLREILPIVSGIIRAQITTQAATSLLTTTVSDDKIKAVTFPLGLVTYWASAYFIRFELVQFRDNIQAEGKKFVIENRLSQSSVPIISLVGKISSGQILIDALKKLKLSTRASVNITLAFAAIGFMALLQKALHYISSDNEAAVEADNEGIVMSYYAGHKEASRLAPKIEITISCVAISLGVIGTFARSATIHKQAHATNINRIALDNEVERSDARIESGYLG